ncbi:MAG TPA: hypothetical protein VG847_15970 [Chitinophagaceae bacterium]|nr:hypothetical protein [Chitinophagaceae bacterium]
MKVFISPLLILLCHYTIFAQQSKLQIGADADIVSKIAMIKNAFPDLIKAFGTNEQAESYVTNYQCNFIIGHAEVTLQKNNSTAVQTLEITFDHYHYLGTNANFKDFFQQLVKNVQAVLGDAYGVTEPRFNAELDELESVSFFNKKYSECNSPILVEVDNYYKKGAVILRIETGRK